MTENPNTFALLVPCYNASLFIDIFLSTLSLQIKKFDEILFYDDASTDNTVELLEKSNHTVIKGSQNMGPSFARNILLNATHCNWVHFHDPDDYLDDNYLLKTSSVSKSGKVDVVLCNVDWLHYQTKKLIIAWKYSNLEINKNALNYTLQNPIGGINGLYNKKKLESINGFDETLFAWEDADLHIRLAANNTKFYIIEETLSYSLRYPQSASSNQGKAWYYRYKALCKYQGLYKQQQLIIGIEAEKAANSLTFYNYLKEAKKCFLLAIKCGQQTPSSKHIIWKILKKILPNFLLIHFRVLQLKWLNTHHQLN